MSAFDSGTYTMFFLVLEFENAIQSFSTFFPALKKIVHLNRRKSIFFFSFLKKESEV